jgi:hypothetical protein
MMTFFIVAVWCFAAPVATAQEREAAPDSTFDHAQHARLFTTCTVCHAQMESPGAARWPEPSACASCHDGEIERRVPWTPRAGPRASNLRFEHDEHAQELQRAGRAGAQCLDCHAESGAPWMSLAPLAVSRCLECHEISVEHVAAPDAACATCHRPLHQAPLLTDERVRAFPAPPSHREPGFAGRGGHGLLAYHPVGAPPRPESVAASCATCHARDFCQQCHVDGPEQPAVRALAWDARSLIHEARLETPASHGEPSFVEKHGRVVRADPRECRTCHTQENCVTCHVATPRVASSMFPASAERGAGAHVVREPPPTHTREFAEWHGARAAARPETCAACHAREDCLDCHRPTAARGAPGYHPADFLARHPSVAYARGSSCSDCHSPAAFCADCHAKAGLTAGSALRRGYHDAAPLFIAGHGQAARQSLESCVACHAERDCLTCHAASVRGGRGFSPHGPGFNPDRQRRKNVEVCTVCHGPTVPR